MSDRNRRSTNGNLMAQGYVPMQTNYRRSRRHKSRMLPIIASAIFLIAAAISLILIFQPQSEPLKRNVIIPVNIQNSTDTNPRAKAWNLTRDEWINRYTDFLNLYSDNFNPSDVFAFDMGTGDYRNLFYIKAGEQVHIYIMSEDTTNKVCAVSVTFQRSADMAAVQQLGTDTSNTIMAVTYACDTELQFEQIVDIAKYANPFSQERKGKESFIYNNNYYTVEPDPLQIVFGVRLNETFASEADFLKYRDGTTL